MILDAKEISKKTTTVLQVIRNMSNILFPKTYRYIWSAIQHPVIRKKHDLMWNIKLIQHNHATINV